MYLFLGFVLFVCFINLFEAYDRLLSQDFNKYDFIFEYKRHIVKINKYVRMLKKMH